MDPRDWLAAALGEGSLPSFDGVEPEQLLQVAEAEGVLPLLDRRWRADGPGAHVDAQTLASARCMASDHVGRHLLRVREIRQVAARLSAAGIRCLLLKGPALAQWLYPEPYLRVTGDIDLLFASRDDAERAAQAVEPLGYALVFTPGPMNYEMTSQRIVDGTLRGELDLHWRLVNAEAYAGLYGFEDLWGDALPLPALGESVHGLSSLHALVHACLNRALDLQNGLPDPLRLRYDIHLMLGRLDDAGWTAFLAHVEHKRVAGICLRSILDTREVFGTALPEDRLQALRLAADNEPLDWRRLDDWRYMQWRHFQAMPSWAGKLRWLWGRLFPSHGHLRNLHGEGSWLQLMARRLKGGIARLRRRG